MGRHNSIYATVELLAGMFLTSLMMNGAGWETFALN